MIHLNDKQDKPPKNDPKLEVIVIKDEQDFEKAIEKIYGKEKNKK